MAISLKALNMPALAAIVAGNFLAYWAFLLAETVSIDDLMSVSGDLKNLAPAGVLCALITVINGLLSADMKARIVFMRWDNPLPGSEAFSRHIYTDARIDPLALERKYGALPTAARDQNALWYRLYKKVSDKAAVIHVHRAYLFARDYSALSLLMLLGLSIGAIAQQGLGGESLSYCAVLFVQLTISVIAARNYGRRFVTTVLALTETED